MDEDPCGINNNSRNKRKYEDEILEVRVAKQSCLCLDTTQSDIQMANSMSAKDSNSVSEDADSVMSYSLLHMRPYDSTSSSSSVNWSGTSFDRSETKTCDAFPSFEDCELSSSECETRQSEALMEDLFCSNGVLSNNSVLSSGRWNVNQDAEQGTEKLTIDKEFEQYFSMLML
ncbi:hypothetical protein R6Q59_019449 [Mikania micrantha]